MKPAPRNPELRFVTLEEEPLQLFRHKASAAIGALLDERGIDLHLTGSAPRYLRA